MSVLLAAVAHAADYRIVAGVPGPLDPGQGILAFVQNGYLLALGVAGLLALGSIVYGAVLYTVSSGNPSKLTDAWDRIVQALIGILLLVGAGTLLSIVNPGLLSLELPQLQDVTGKQFETAEIKVSFEDEEAVSPSVPVTAIKATVSCKADKTKCVSLKDLGYTCANADRKCNAHEQIAKILQCVTDKQELGLQKSDIRIPEAYPPSGKHIDPRHRNGCSIDTTLSKRYKQGGCDAIKAYVAAIKECGGTALNEYADKDRDGGSFAGCGVKPVDKKTGQLSWFGNNVHVNGCPRGTI